MDIPSPFTVQYDDIDLLKRFTGYMKKVVTYARIDYYRRQKHRRQEVPLDEIPPGFRTVRGGFFAHQQK